MSNEPFGPPYHSQQYLETYFLYEHPKAEDITPQQKSYIQTYIRDFETALLTDDFSTSERTYTDYIDLSSFVDYFILNELTGNIDAYRLSTYMHKDKSGLLKMGPVWDLNIGYNRQDRVPTTDWIANYNQYVSQDAWMVPFWWTRLLEDPVFKTALRVRWNELRNNTLSNSNVLNLVSDTSNYLNSNRINANLGLSHKKNRFYGNSTNFTIDKVELEKKKLGYGQNKRSSEHIGMFGNTPFDQKMHKKYLQHEKIENLQARTLLNHQPKKSLLRFLYSIIYPLFQPPPFPF